MSRELENNRDIWLSEEEACSLLGIKSETLRKNCKQDKYIYKIKKLKSGNKYKILLNSNWENTRKKKIDFGLFKYLIKVNQRRESREKM